MCFFMFLTFLLGAEVYILPYDTYCSMVAAALLNAGTHLHCLLCHLILPKCPGGKAYQVEDIAVCSNKGAVWF